MAKTIISGNTANESKIEIMHRGMTCLREVLGLVDAEKFIAFVNSEQLDYTKWQREYFDQMTPEQIEKEALDYIAANPYEGDPATII